jgi:hypothetical protein
MSDSAHHRTFEVLTADPVWSRRKPRHRLDEEKAQHVTQAFSPGANVSASASFEGLDAPMRGRVTSGRPISHSRRPTRRLWREGLVEQHMLA